jgi:ADP-ribose diphosphatase
MRDKDTVLLVREYGAGIDRYHISLPRGAIDEGESVFESANRELKEEIGYGAHNFQHLRRLALSPNYMGTITELVLARDLYEERLPGDEPEQPEVVPWSLAKLDDLLGCEEFWETYALSALYMARDFMRNEESEAKSD